MGATEKAKSDTGLWQKLNLGRGRWRRSDKLISERSHERRPSVRRNGLPEGCNSLRPSTNRGAGSAGRVTCESGIREQEDIRRVPTGVWVPASSWDPVRGPRGWGSHPRPSEAVTRCAHYITQHKFQPLCPTQYEKPKSGSSPGPTASDEGGVTSLTQQSHKHQSAGKRAIARETSLATPSPHMHMLGPAAFSGTARRRLR